jgi:hypothetical protein
MKVRLGYQISLRLGYQIPYAGPVFNTHRDYNTVYKIIILPVVTWVKNLVSP